MVLRFGQPSSLRLALAGLTAVGLLAIALALSIPIIGKKKFLAVQTFASGLRRLHRVPKSGGTSIGKPSYQAEENPLGRRLTKAKKEEDFSANASKKITAKKIQFLSGDFDPLLFHRWHMDRATRFPGAERYEACCLEPDFLTCTTGQCQLNRTNNDFPQRQMNPDPGRSIRCASYDGQEIPNWIDVDPSPEAVEFTRRSLRRGNLVLTGIVILAPPTGRYNCHGLVFGNRRTNIGILDFETDIDDLLNRDEYRRVRAPQLSDIVVYRSTSSREIMHTGFVSRVESVGTVEKVFVMSKWGALEECEHLAPCCPYENCAIEYWRLRA